MVFDHKVHHFDTKGKLRKLTPYRKIVRMGCPEIYFDVAKKRFFDPGTMKDYDLRVVPDDVFERCMGMTKEEAARKNKPAAPKKEAKKKPGPKKGAKKKVDPNSIDPDDGPIEITSEG